MNHSKNPFRYFDSSPEVIRMVVMMYVRYPLSLGNVEDLLSERGVDICHETVRLWWKRFGGHCQSKLAPARLARLACPHEPAQNPFRYFDSLPEVIRLVQHSRFLMREAQLHA